MKIIIKANAYTSNPNKRGVSEAPQNGNNSGHENRQGPKSNRHPAESLKGVKGFSDIVITAVEA